MANDHGVASDHDPDTKYNEVFHKYPFFVASGSDFPGDTAHRILALIGRKLAGDGHFGKSQSGAIVISEEHSHDIRVFSY